MDRTGRVYYRKAPLPEAAPAAPPASAATPAPANAAPINDAINTGMQVGMISRDASIKNLFLKKLITKETAMEAMKNPELLNR